MDRRCKFTKEQKQEMVEMYLSGKSSVEIGKRFNITNTNVIGYLNRAGIKRRTNKENSRKYSVNNDYFDKIDNEEKAYWLGFLYADGYVIADRDAFGVALSIKDINHLYKLNSCLNSIYNVKIYNQKKGYSKGNDYCRLVIYSEKIKKDLIKYGCFENKTNILKAPPINKKLFKYFIRGYLDGDGCITKSLNKKNTFDYKVKFCGTIDLLNFIKEFIEEKNIAKINRFYTRKKGQIVKQLELGGNNQVKKFLDLIYDNPKIYLERKYDIVKEFYKYINSRA